MILQNKVQWLNVWTKVASNYLWHVAATDIHNHILKGSAALVSWRSGYHYCTTSFNKIWTQVLRRSNLARYMSGICDGEDLRQWSRLDIRLSWSTRPQKQFITIIIITGGCSSYKISPSIHWNHWLPIFK